MCRPVAGGVGWDKEVPAGKAMHLRDMHAFVVESDGRARHSELLTASLQGMQPHTTQISKNRISKQLSPLCAPVAEGPQRRCRCRSASRRTGRGRASCGAGEILSRKSLQHLSRDRDHARNTKNVTGCIIEREKSLRVLVLCLHATSALKRLAE